ncbi:ARM repeat-containing protein [Punctularia strigosozonata HHB-11173 SS5]|uniref:ARM repeat-containing protein n=1 Tax=Punctularia strigosozonata (strain HHB-11173) TaxID=741275 RepID=UPI0004418076|nr:ARM repeat-containing protein [Punctularia strigosozonata HHB-11173 SS5]EIN12803.1 ARM repeat-containing protein [Punctularia strigosozonata HHB-11173 SS5]
MDLHTLSSLFATTYNPDPNVRKAAELEIRKVGVQEGMLTALLQIIAEENVELATRQACSVYLKNRVYTSYTVDPAVTRPRPDQTPIHPSDKDALKASILRLLAASPSRSVTVQLADTFKNAVARDFPDNWPGLLDQVKALLISSNIQDVAAGCIASLEVVRAFRFRQDSKILPDIVANLFPTLVSIANQMLNSPPPGVEKEIPFMLHLILKTYKTSTMVQLTAHQQSAESLVPWGRLLFQVVNLQIPKDAVPEDEEEREKSEWWKAKKWAYGILGRLFHRYGNPSQLPTVMRKDYGAFAEHFITVFAPEIFKVYLHQVELYVAGQAWLSSKCQYQIFSFFTECVKPKSTWVLLKPHFETLVSSFVFPLLCFNSSKQELWDTDPVDYIRVSVDEYETYTTPVSAATTFLFALASSRTKATFESILTFIYSVLRSNPASPQRFGALNMVAALGPFIMSHPEVKTNMESFMLQHVLPEFSSSDGYMRAIACEVLGTVEKSRMDWANEQNISSHLKAVATALDDPELPVKVQAALALTEMVKRHEKVREAVSPQVGKVIQDLLKMADETDLDILNSCMETMVDYFQDELVPVAAQLAARLCDSYLRLVREAMASDEAGGQNVDLDNIMESDTDDDKTYAAMGVAKTIGTVISSIDSSPEILAQVQEAVIPIVVFTLENKFLDLFDNVYDLVDALTFKLHSIAPAMWQVFELTYKLFKSDAIDFLDEMLPALDNFISYGPEVFKARSDYKDMALDIYVTAMASEQLGENDRVNGCKLAESMLLNLRGYVDEAFPKIVATALDHMDSAETNAFRLANLEVLINAVLYNPSAALHLMESHSVGASRVFFDKWFAIIKDSSKLPRVHDKKLSIAALCALMEVEASAIPRPLQAGWAGIVAGALKIFQDLPKAIAARKALEEAFGDDDDDDDDDGRVLNLNEDDEDVLDEDTAYLEMLAQESARLRERSDKLDDDAEESVSSEESDIEEELGYLSPLDQIDPYIVFQQALTTMQNKNPAMYQACTTSLSIDQQTLLMEVVAIAQSNAAQTHASS